MKPDLFEDDVYFLRDGDKMKIGYTSRGGAPSRRKELQTGNPNELILYGVCPGSYRIEQALHRRYDAYRVRPKAEWFRATEGFLKDLAVVMEVLSRAALKVKSEPPCESAADVKPDVVLDSAGEPITATSARTPDNTMRLFAHYWNKEMEREAARGIVLTEDCEFKVTTRQANGRWVTQSWPVSGTATSGYRIRIPGTLAKAVAAVLGIKESSVSAQAMAHDLESWIPSKAASSSPVRTSALQAENSGSNPDAAITKRRTG